MWWYNTVLVSVGLHFLKSVYKEREGTYFLWWGLQNYTVFLNTVLFFFPKMIMYIEIFSLCSVLLLLFKVVTTIFLQSSPHVTTVHKESTCYMLSFLTWKRHYRQLYQQPLSHIVPSRLHYYLFTFLALLVIFTIQTCSNLLVQLCLAPFHPCHDEASMGHMGSYWSQPP